MNHKLIAGFGGAVCLNILHESLKNTHEDMPRIDLVGSEALLKSLGAIGVTMNDSKQLYYATLAGDLISNGVYNSFIFSKKKNLWMRATAIGLAAGVGAVVLPKPLGLNDQPITKTDATKALTIGYYLFGALAAVAIYKAIKK